MKVSPWSVYLPIQVRVIRIEGRKNAHGFFSVFFFKFPLLLNSLTNIGDGFIVFWTDITEIKMALVIDWLNLFSQQLATLCEPKQEDVDLSSWDFFPLSTKHRVNLSILSAIYRSKPGQKCSGNLTCISITPEWLSRDKSWHMMQKNPLLFMPPSFWIFFLSLSP